ncbi:MAG: hypothetical protein WBM32_05660 [Crocosphaera sp.]
MKDNTTINLAQKIFLNVSLILLGICANGTFFSAMITLLLGTVVLGYLRSQTQPFPLTPSQSTQEAEKLPVTRF